MEREFVYTRDKLRFILADVLERDIRGNPVYLADDRVEEGFEKRAVLEFLLWFIEQGFPEEGAFPYTYEDLERDYPEHVAQRIAEGRGWSTRRMGGGEGPDNLVVVDFSKRK